MTSESNARTTDPTELRIRRILDSEYPLCRDDVVWMLGFIKKGG